MNCEIDKLLILAIDIAKKTKQHIWKNVEHGRSVKNNNGRDVKLIADFESDSFIVKQLTNNSTFPIISEESGKTNFDNKNCNDYYWIIDPLDGSFNFSREIPMACISISLWKENSPIIGVVLDVNRDELFYASIKGAYLNDKKITVSTVNIKNQSVLCTGFPIATNFNDHSINNVLKNIQHFKKIRLLGSAALSLSYVACGRAEVYMEQDIRIWDVAAGLALVKFAGGKIKFNATSNETTLKVIASNGHIEDL